MPTFQYRPLRNVTPEHIYEFSQGSRVTLSTTDISGWTDRADTKRTTRTTKGGRTKVITEYEKLLVDLDIENISIEERRVWIEFIRSVNCGERFNADLCDLPGFVYNVDQASAFMQEDPQWSESGLHTWALTMTICFDAMGDVL